MSGEITTADDLEAITSELGTNMAAEKMVIQASIVRDNVYLAASKASELLLSVSNDLLSALNGEYFEEEIKTYTNRSAVLRAKRKLVEIDAKIYEKTEDGYKDGYLVRVYPSKGKITLNLQNQVSEAKILAGFSGRMAELPLLAAIGAAVLGPAGAALGVFASIAHNGISFLANNDAPLKAFKSEDFFRDYARFALEVTPEEAKKFLNDYIALPETVYRAVEGVIGRNKLLANNLDEQVNGLRLLEEKLR